VIMGMNRLGFGRRPEQPSCLGMTFLVRLRCKSKIPPLCLGFTGKSLSQIFFRFRHDFILLAVFFDRVATDRFVLSGSSGEIVKR